MCRRLETLRSSEIWITNDSIVFLVHWRRGRRAARQSGRWAPAAVLGGLGAVLGVRALSAQGTIQTCALPIYAEVYVGPYLGTVYEGTLSLDIDETGAIESGTFQTIDGQSVPLVGQADGRALDLRIDLGNGLLLTLTGTAELPFSVCQGAAATSFAGPEMGNMGNLDHRRGRIVRSGRLPRD